MKRLFLFSIFLLSIAHSALAQTSTVTWGTTHQTIDGFGAYDINISGQFNTSSAVLNQLFTTTGNNVGLSILRVPVPDAGAATGTDPTGNCSTVNTGCANVTTEESFAYGQGVRIFATPWSPPASMKSNSNYDCGSGGGSGKLNTGSYGSFATWLSNYITSKTNAGINLYALSVQNEPDVCPTGYGGALWTAANIQTFVKTNLGPTLTSAGQTSVKVVIPESGGYSVNGGGLHTGMDSYASACLNDSSCAPYVSICAAHDYEVTHPWSPGPDSLCANAGKRLWQTEIYQGSTYDGSMTDGIIWAQDIHKWLANANANAWLWWQIFSPYSDNEPLYQPGTTTPSKRLFVMGQWSKFVRPGWIRIDSTAGASGVLVSAFKSADGTSYAIVAVNPSGSTVSQTIALSGFPTTTSVTPYQTNSTNSLTALTAVNISGSSFTYSLPATSVTTFVGQAASSSTGCPTSASYLSMDETTAMNQKQGLTAFSKLSDLGVTNCYYIASNGSDSNTGTDESHPWAHLPGMPSWTGSHTPVAGEGYIFRGGDTWGVANFGINWSWHGSAGSPIYIGVDQNWYSGSSWTRPIWTTGNSQTFNGYLWSGNGPYVIVDNFEANNVYYSETVGTGFSTVSGHDVTIENIYFHGWSYHKPWTSTSMPSPDVFYFGHGAPSYVNDTLRFCYVTGVDESPGPNTDAIVFVAGDDLPNVYGNYFDYVYIGLDGAGDNWHDNVINHMGIPIDNAVSGASYHQDAFYQKGSLGYNSVVTIYNNWTGNQIDWSGANGAVKWFMGTYPVAAGVTGNYFFNNVGFNNDPSNNLDFGGHWAYDYGVWYWFNNTLECGRDANLIDCSDVSDKSGGNETTSTTSMTLSTGSHTLTIANPTYFSLGTVGGPIAVSVLNASPPQVMYGTVTSYTSPTLVFNVTSCSPSCTGTQYSSWFVAGKMTWNWINNHFISSVSTTPTATCYYYTCSMTTNLAQTISGANSQGYTSTGTYAFQPTLNTGSTINTGTNESARCTEMSNAGLTYAASQCAKGTTYAVTVNSANQVVFPALSPVSRTTTDIGAYEYSGAPSSCPTAANYLPNYTSANPFPSTLTTLAARGVTTCYYIAANGSDSNTGADEAHPWLHAPKMTGATGTAAAHTPTAGDGYIFRGGDTWNQSNFTWQWTQSGTATNPIYVGVDKSWYSGGSWTRPIFNLGLTATWGSSNAYGILFNNYVIIDNIEGIGQYETSSFHPNFMGVGANSSYENNYFHGWGHDSTFNIWIAGGAGCNPVWAANTAYGTLNQVIAPTNANWNGHLYKVTTTGTSGATEPTWPTGSGATVTSGTVVFTEEGQHPGSCQSSIQMMTAPQTSKAGTVGRFNVVDGSDTDKYQALAFGHPSTPPTIYANYMGYTTCHACGTFDVAHDNIFEHLADCGGNGCGHQDDLYQYCSTGTLPQMLIYNNRIQHETGAWEGGAVKLWISGNCASTGMTGFVFDNVIFDTYPGNVFNTGSHFSNYDYGTWNIFNNTISCGTDSADPSSNSHLLPCALGGNILFSTATGSSMTLHLSNNHWVQQNGSPLNCSVPAGNTYTCDETNDVEQSLATANSQGYNDTASAYAFQPTQALGSTVGAGISRTSLCGTITDTFAQSVCLRDTTYAITYNTTNHTVTYPNRTSIARGNPPNVGAYELTGPIVTISPSPVNFPSQALGIVSSPLTVTITSSGTANATLGTPFYTITGANAGDFTRSGGTCIDSQTMAPGNSCTILIVNTPSINGAETATLNITGSAPTSATINGTGIGGVVSLNPTSLTFGNIIVGGTSTSQQITLTNNGPGLLTISNISIAGDFSQTNNCSVGSPMAVNASCTFSVTFSPTQAGVRSGSLTITSNGSNSPTSASLSGTGITIVYNSLFDNGAALSGGAKIQ